MNWSKNYDCCVSCGNDALKHCGKGLCKRCYQSKWAIKHSRRLIKYKHTWYVKSKKKIDYKERSRIQRNGKYAVELAKTGKCAICGTKKNIQIHHKDHMGHNVPTRLRNNSPDNIELLCIVCHGRLHGNITGWSRKHEECISCGRTDRKHQAKGYCTACYYKYQE